MMGPETNDRDMTLMKFFRTLFVAAALVSTHWMGMSMARAFVGPSDEQASRSPAGAVAVPAVSEEPASTRPVVIS